MEGGREDCYTYSNTVVPVTNGHPQDQAKLSVHCRWPLIRGNLTLKCVGRGIDNVAVHCRWPLIRGTDGHVETSRDIDKVAVHSRWPLTTGVAQARYYCSVIIIILN